MPPHLLTNFQIQKYYQNETKFNYVYSRNNLSKASTAAVDPQNLNIEAAE